MNILFINLRYRKVFMRHRTVKDMYTDKRVTSSQLLCPATNETLESIMNVITRGLHCEAGNKIHALFVV